jgi:hypothetical protein
VVFEVKEDLNNKVSWNRLPITAFRDIWYIACLKMQMLHISALIFKD